MLSMIILTLTGVLVLFLGFTRFKSGIIPLGIVGVICAFYAYFLMAPVGEEWMLGMMTSFGAPKIFTGVLMMSLLFILPFLKVYEVRGGGELSDFTGLVLFSVIGGMMMVAHQDLMILFLGIEILSIAMYILAGADRRVIQSNEASIKYFIMGAFASAIFLFGVGLYYTSTGSFKIYDIQVISLPLYQLSMMIMFAGLAFKLALAPFHFWAPDVYQGSPTIFTAVMASLVKISGFGALFQLMKYQMDFNSDWMYWLIVLISLSSMAIGNIMASQQTSVKRLLAYSGTVQAGFILLAFIQIKAEQSWMVIYYLIAYVLASLASFFVIYFVESRKGSDEISEFRGLYFQNPILAVVFTIALISLGGGPLTAGFMAKLFVLSHASDAGAIALVVIALVFAVISMYYYFKVVNQFFIKEPESGSWSLNWTFNGLLVILSAATLIVGTFPYWITVWIK